MASELLMTDGAGALLLEAPAASLAAVGASASLGLGEPLAALQLAGSEASLLMQGSTPSVADPQLTHVGIIASYLSVELTATRSSAAFVQFRVWRGWYQGSSISAEAVLDSVILTGLPAGNGWSLEARVWTSGGFDSGWYDTGIDFDTPGRDDDPIHADWPV